jgi:hypothetical protein
MKRPAALLAIFALLLAAMALKGALLTLPSPPAQANGTGFDANRAQQRLARILGDQRPHPVDTAGGDAARSRLIAEMQAVGLTPRLSDDFACNGRRGQAVTCARVRNLVATIGPAQGRHLLLVSHYDSTPAGPGASDDGIGVATMLEVASLLREQQLARPITFLFDEGEEAGLIGARAFIERDPVAAEVDVAVNLESRGVTGPAIMFETSRPNGPAIALFRAAVARPVANSLSTDLYRLIPNSTDVTVFAERPWTILNFAVIGNETRYHSAGDDLASLDPRSLQHMGEQTLEIARLAAMDGAPAATGERLYTDIIGQVLIEMPLLFGLAMLGLLLIFFIVASWRRRALGLPLLGMVAALIGAGLFAFAGHFVVQLLRAGDYWRAFPLVTTTAVYASALAACAIGLLSIARTPEQTRLRAAFWLLFLLVGAAICIVAPGAAIYFLLPPLVAAIGMAARRFAPWAERAGGIAATVLLYLTFGPAVDLFEELMNGGPLWAFAPLGATMLLPALIELRPIVDRAWPAFALAALGWIAAGLAPAYSVDRQQLFTIEYVWDEAAHEGRFAINNDGAPVPYDGAWARTEMPYTTRKRWAAPAPAVPVPAPTASIVAQRPVAGGRIVRLRIAANGAENVTLIAPAAARLWGAAGGGFVARFGANEGGDRYAIRCAGRACDGATIDVAIGTAAPVDLTIVGTRSGLPAAARALVRARPADARPQYAPDSTISLGRIRI